MQPGFDRADRGSRKLLNFRHFIALGVEMAGFPGQSEISWETSLNKGRNLLPLKLIALTPVGGELLARLEHDDRDRVFRLQVDVS